MKIERLTLGALQTNCYIIYDEASKEAAIIDPADQFEIIKPKISELKLNVKYIIITHAHCDHIGALDKLCEYTGAKVCIGENDANSLNDDYLNLSMYFGTKSPTHTADVLLGENSSLNLGSESLIVVQTPGHTRGGICIIWKNILFSGDTLFLESVGRTDFPTSNSSELLSSIKSRLFSLSPDTKVYPGHGDSTTIGHEIKHNPFIW